MAVVTSHDADRRPRRPTFEARIGSHELVTGVLGAGGVLSVIVALGARDRLGLVAAAAAPVVGAIAIVHGTRRHRPERAVAWSLVALSCIVHSIAIALRADELLGGGAIGPGRAEAVTLLAYPAMFVGAWAISTRASTHAADGPWLVIVTVVATLTCWFVAVPFGVTDGSLPLSAATWVGVFALLDTILALLVARRVFRVRERNWALWVMTAGFVVWGNAHGAVGTQLYDDTLELGSVAWATLSIGPLLLGVAGNLPSMAHTEAVADGPDSARRRSLLELAAGVVLGLMFASTLAAAAGAPLLALIGVVSSFVVVGAAGSALHRPSSARSQAPPLAPPSAPEPMGGRPGAHTSTTAERPGAGSTAPDVATHHAGRTTAGGLTAAVDGQLDVEYLPYVDLGSGLVLGVEALLRWRHPMAGLLHPPEFLDGPNRTIRERDVGRWVVERTLGDLAGWAAPADFMLGINASAAQLDDDLWTEHLLSTCRRMGADPRNIIVEAPERTFDRRDVDVRGNLDRLRRRGVTIASDDFDHTTGSLHTLVDAPVDLVKVRVGARANDRTDEHLVALRIAQESGLATAVVGIDSDELLHRVRTIGVDFGQGFRLSPPLAAATVAELLSEAARPAQSSMSPATSSTGWIGASEVRTMPSRFAAIRRR